MMSLVFALADSLLWAIGFSFMNSDKPESMILLRLLAR
jgi:hypothetical protein